MIYSTYNTVCQLTENVYSLYNAVNDKFIVLKKSILNDLNLSPNELKIRNIELFEELLNAGAIIDSNKNEYSFLKNLSKSIDSNHREFRLIVNPTLDCNLRCWYCYENHIKGSSISSEVLRSLKQLIIRIFNESNELEHFQLNFFGGEPLLYFKVVKDLITFISGYCTNKKVSLGISFTTNGYLVNEKKVQFLRGVSNDIGFQITLDGNRSFHNKVRFISATQGTYDKILNNIQLLLKNNMFVVLRINYTKENISSIPDILDDIKGFDNEYKKFLRIDFQRVWQDDNDDLDIDNLLELFSNENFFVSSPENNLDQLRSSCYADKQNELTINYNGDIYKCTARDFSTENRDGYLSEDGTIHWTGITPTERIEKKMTRNICKECNILPLCGGGCSQKCIELNDKDVCMYDYNEDDKKKIVLNRFYNQFVTNC